VPFGFEGADALADEHGVHAGLNGCKLALKALVEVRELVDQARALLSGLVVFEGGSEVGALCSEVVQTLPNSSRRLVNQAIFLTLTVRDPDTIKAKLTPLYDEIARFARNLQQAKQTPETAPKRPRTPQNKAVCPQDDHDPVSWGRGSYIEQMAALSGCEHETSWR
jgi:hypothetical protein